MTLQEAINQYVVWRQTMGTQFVSGVCILRCYCQSIGGETGCDAVTDEQVLAFLKGKGPLTRYRANKYTVLSGFYRYAISRGYATRWPLPTNEPKEPRSALPYIFSHDELRRLFDAVDVCRRRAVQLEAPTFRTLLFLLYGTGLRRGEALRLTVADVDLTDALLTVRNSKFYKSRLVPVGQQLSQALQEYATWREANPAAQRPDSTFLVNRDGTPLACKTVHEAFHSLRQAAGISAANARGVQPCFHSLRHYLHFLTICSSTTKGLFLLQMRELAAT